MLSRVHKHHKARLLVIYTINSAMAEDVYVPCLNFSFLLELLLIIRLYLPMLGPDPTVTKIDNTYYLNANGTYADTLLPVGSQFGTIRAYEIVQAFFSQPFQVELFDYKYSFDNHLLWYDATTAIFGDVYLNTNGCPQSVPSQPFVAPISYRK